MTNLIPHPCSPETLRLSLGKVWHVDADEVERFQTRKKLSIQKLYTSYTDFPSVTSAVSQLKSSETMPNIILLELFLPQKGGMALLEELQKLPEYKRNQIKVIVLTSWLNYRPLLIHQALDFPEVLGCLEKPLRINELLTILYQPIDKITAMPQ